MLSRAQSFLLLLLLSACAPTPAWSAAALPTRAAEPSRAPAAPPTAAETPTVPPPTPLPAPTPTPLPTLPPALANLRIAYAGAGKLWLWQAGETRALSSVLAATYLVAFSPGGQSIAYSSGDDLWAIAADGSGKTLLLAPDDLAEMKIDNQAVGIGALEWVPNAQQIVFSTLIQKYGIRPAGDLYRIDALTGERARLLAPGQGGQFTLSPDGNWAAVVTPQRVKLVHLASREVFQAFSFDPVWTPTEEDFYPQPVWAPDSLSLWVAVPPYDAFTAAVSPARILRVDVQTRQVQEIARIGAELGQEIFLSPDLTTLLTRRRLDEPPGNGHFGEIHLASLDGSNAIAYRRGRYAFRGWSPDSRSFLLENADGLWVGRPYQPLQKLSLAADGFAWLTGETFLYRREVDGGEEIGVGFTGDRYLPLLGPLEITGFDYFAD